MGKILKFIEKETEGRCFTSYRYCFDTEDKPQILFEEAKNSYTYLKDYAENNHNPQSRDLSKLAESCFTQVPLFRYFLDGSRKVYKLDDIQYDKTVYPMLSGQISVACCERENDEAGKFHSFRHIEEEIYNVLCLPVTANTVGENDDVFFNGLCSKIISNPICGSRTNLKKVLSYSTQLDGKETFERKAIGRIQDDMVDCEKSIVSTLMSKHLLSQDRYLVKDGSIQYKTTKTGDYKEIVNIRSNYRHVVGVSKSFNPNLMKDKKGQSSAGEIANLPLYHRTPAFLWQPGNEWGDVNFAIWYVRIRDTRFTATPYSGILKIEKMLMTGTENEQGLSSDEIDLISANIINERNPVCYGTDSRWANHIYPVYMTESYCKSRFMSDQYFINLF